MHHYPNVYVCKKNFFKISSKLMENLAQILQDSFPKLRERQEGETTPEYLNYINTVVNQAHQEILQLSPFCKISEIFKSRDPLSLEDIKIIFKEVDKHNSC
jgi:formate dehydrogenase maturation protein FdhE